MKIRNRLLGSLSLIAVMGVASLASVSDASALAASGKSGSKGVQVGIFYSPSIFNGKIDISSPAGYTIQGDTDEFTQTVDFKDHTDFSWLGGGAKVGYRMGNIVISAVTDYRKADYYANKDNKDAAYAISGKDGDFSKPSVPSGSDVDSGGLSELENVAPKPTDAAAYKIDFKDVSKWYSGIDVDYMVNLTKGMSASVGVGAGMEYNTINVKYSDKKGGSINLKPPLAAPNVEAKLTALPFVMQGNLGFGYEVMPGITPYVGYTLRYSFETDFDSNSLAVRHCSEDKIYTDDPDASSNNTVDKDGNWLTSHPDPNNDQTKTTNLPIKLKSNVDHIFKVGVNFTF
ncbi:hypothetical protein GUI12_02495 [Anaplasmataceae bacterium AB001_6]|nr:hypothetical protein GUI12_02495 [Anaplasmataceae bacterium AB001_6]